MIAASDIAAAKAVSIAEVVGAVVALKRAGREFRGICPFHNEKTPSFFVFLPNHYHCFGCGAHGDVIAFVMRARGLDFAEAVSFLCNRDVRPAHAGGSITPAARPSATHRAAGAAAALPDILALWRSASAPRLAEYYLYSRGIALRALPEALRGHQRVWCSETQQYRPATLAAVSGPGGNITAIQRTWISDHLDFDGTVRYAKGARAPDLADPKKTWGTMGSGAVRLALAGPVLGLAEGTETALSAAQLFKLPVWSTCGASRLGSIELPECVHQVIIFGDHGGEAAAHAAVSAYCRRGYEAEALFPSRGGDFNEELMR